MNKKNNYFFTSESVSKGHPDKVCDQISDAILDAYLEKDKNAHVAVETMVTRNQVILAGEINSTVEVNVEDVVRNVIRSIGYMKKEYNFDCDTVNIINLLHKQSPDINQGVSRGSEEEQGAGDQGIMFGYATNETPDYIPLTLWLAHNILKRLDEVRECNVVKYLRPDAKSQVTIEFNEKNEPVHIDTILISTSHDEFMRDNVVLRDEVVHDIIENDITNLVIKHFFINDRGKKIAHLYDDKTKIIVNPTGKFVVCGPDGDSGVTGRKIIVDTYGGYGAHGGGAFSGKDTSKVDRSGAYMTRYIAKNIVATGLCDKCLIQISYAIGVAEPTSFNINTYGTNHTKYSDAELSSEILKLIDLRPGMVEKNLNLRVPIYSKTASYGHFGHTCDGLCYPWEALTLVDKFSQLLTK